MRWISSSSGTWMFDHNIDLQVVYPGKDLSNPSAWTGVRESCRSSAALGVLVFGDEVGHADGRSSSGASFAFRFLDVGFHTKTEFVPGGDCHVWITLSSSETCSRPG